ncbi:MAG: hypothetical protein J6C52_13190 [Clostridia bacterium]|nr:hypothetical protein [Clostridia bacterium]
MKQNFLHEFEAMYRGVLPWYASLYDAESGGFYAAASGKADPVLHTGLEMTGSVLVALHHHGGGLWETMPAYLRDRFIAFFHTRFDKSTGYFEEPTLEAQDRDTADRFRARIQSFSKNALNLLGAPFTMPAENGRTITPILPAQFESPEAYVEWMRGLCWDTNSWTAGDRVQASQNYLRLMDAPRRQPYLDAMFAYLEEAQDPITGYWGNGTSYRTLSGAFKVDLIYGAYDRPLPRAAKVLESVFTTIRTEDAACPCYVRNSIDLLGTLANRHGYADEIRWQLSAESDGILAASGRFLTPDGGFSSSIGKSMGVYGGVRVGHSLCEGDIDGTSMMLIARQTLYGLLGVEIPPLSDTMPDFWEHLK